MAAKQPALDVNSFELAQELVARGRRSWILNLVCMCVAAIAVFAVMLQASKPANVIYWSDDPNRPAELVVATPGESEVREVDAKRFMRRYGDLVLGWNSGTVTDDLKKATLLQTAAWNKVFEAQLNAKVTVPASMGAQDNSMSVYGTYLAASVRNSLHWDDWTTTRCLRVAESRVWNCKAFVVVETQPLIGAPLNGPDTKRRLEVQAQFREVPPTEVTLDGLLVEFWNQVDVK